MRNQIRLISISDIHVGGRTTPTWYIIENLKKYLFPVIPHSDIIFFGGDLFDRRLDMPDNDVRIILEWISDLILLCFKHNVMIRVLNGTPLHDNDQSLYFLTIQKMLNLDIDLQYIDTLKIEYISKFDINVLYLPDEYKGQKASDTQLEISNLLFEKGLTQVDYAFIHGYFKHQVPPAAKIDAHDNEFYEKIVNKFIFLGHVHIASQYGKFLANGSFDRDSHGYEQDKGFYYVVANNKNNLNDKITFIINKDAMIFKTFTISNKTSDQLKKILEKINKIVDGSYIKIKHLPSDVNLPEVLSYKQKRPLINWSFEKEKQKKNNQEQKTKVTLYQPVQINNTSILSLMKDRMTLNQHDESTINDVLELVNNLE